MKKNSHNNLILLLFPFSVLAMLTLAVGTGFFMRDSNDFLLNYVQRRLGIMSQVAARQVTAKELDAIVEPGDMEKSLYPEIRRRLMEFTRTYDVLFVSYMREDSAGKLRYIVDSALIKPETPASPLRDMETAQRQALEGQIKVIHAGEHGHFSGYAPIWNVSGRVAAIAEVKIKDEAVIRMRWNSLLFTGLLIFSSLIVAASGAMNFILYRHKTHNAETASKAKSDFLSRMSHDMRTPLNVIIGLSGLSLDSGKIPEDARDNIKKVHNSGLALLGLINDILDLSKIESGSLALLPDFYDLPSLINDITTLHSMRSNKDVQFKIQIDANMPAQIYGDEIRVKQIFNNLLSNAFKYTQAGKVEWNLSFEREGDNLWLISSLKDTGIGIQAENLDKIFQDYYQVKHEHYVQGTGPGLSIVKKLVDMMGGAIKVESAYGKGSVFTLRLRQRYMESYPIGQEVVDNLCNVSYLENKWERYSQWYRIKLPYARVLLVDDVPTNLDVARGMLMPYGMAVDCASSGQEAVDLVRTSQARYNAIFMDHMMPGMNGVEAARLIRDIGTEYAREVPLIALTANAIIGNAEMFLSNGFQAFLSKPIDMVRLDMIVRQWVRNKEQEGEDRRQGADRRVRDRRVHMDRHAGAETIRDWKIEGLDLVKAEDRFDGDEATLLQVLRVFVQSTPAQLEAMHAGQKDWGAYVIAVHGVKGSCYSICADVLGKQAENLEQAARQGDLDIILQCNDVFIKNMEQLLEDLAQYLADLDIRIPKPLKNRPDADLLQRLAAACADYDMDKVDAIMREMESFTYAREKDLAIWLREKVDSMDFKQIVERLSRQGRMK